MNTEVTLRQIELEAIERNARRLRAEFIRTLFGNAFSALTRKKAVAGVAHA